jgi:hypothetical protein
VDIETRELYASPDGERWYLARQADSQQVYVLHVTQAPSGPRTTHIAIGEFLDGEGHPPEQQALLRLIGTLAEGRFDAA